MIWQVKMIFSYLGAADKMIERGTLKQQGTKHASIITSRVVPKLSLLKITWKNLKMDHFLKEATAQFFSTIYYMPHLCG